MNNLYLISQDKVNDWDTYDSAVVSAKDEHEARRVHPGGDWGGYGSSWVKFEDVECVKVELLGTTDKPTGVILASFNAG